MSYVCPAVHWPLWSTGDAIWALPARYPLRSWNQLLPSTPTPTLTCPDTSIHPDTHWSSKGSLSRWSCSQFTWDGVLGERTVSGNKSAAPPVSRLCTKLMETNPVGRFSACRNPQSRVFLTVLSAGKSFNHIMSELSTC